METVRSSETSVLKEPHDGSSQKTAVFEAVSFLKSKETGLLIMNGEKI
jgi:hypothetical protein